MTIPSIITKARELLASATPGPFRRQGYTILSNQSHPVCTFSADFHRQCEWGTGEDEDFYVFARNHLPEILDELDRRGRAIEVMMDEMRSWGAHGAIIRAQAILSGESEKT